MRWGTIFRLGLGVSLAPILLIEFAYFAKWEPSLNSVWNVPLYIGLLIPSILLHELGHAVAAKALGFRVPRIAIGVGRRLWARRWRGTAIHLHAFPSLGFTFFGADDIRAIRLRYWLAIAAGPLVTAAVTLLSWWLQPGVSLGRFVMPAEAVAEGPALFEILGFQNFWLFVLNALPIPFIRAGGVAANDGMQLLMIPFASAVRIREVLTSADVIEAQELAEADDHDGARRVLSEALARVPESFSVRNSLALVDLDCENYRDARGRFVELLGIEPPEPGYALVVRNNIAWADYCMGDPTLMREADEHSAAVLNACKNAPWARGTRGAVLAWIGRSQEALALLEQAYAVNGAPTSRALNASAAAEACAAMGDIEEADRWLQRAQDNHPRCVLLPRARARVDAIRSAATAVV